MGISQALSFIIGRVLFYDQSVQEGRKTLEGYGVWDWIAKYKLNPFSELRNEIFFRVENIFDHRYAVSMRPYGLRPGKPRSLSLGFSYVF